MPEPSGLAVDPADQIPIIVGVTGKRQFSKEAAENARLFAEFETRFRALVEYLDSELPWTPKVLLCGGAAGVDLLSARVVLEGGDEPKHPAWAVAIVLAFEREVFLQDFREDAVALALFEEIERHPRTIMKTLRPLYVAPSSPEEFADSDAERVALASLGRDTSERTARGEHFEQFGLWLARSSTILVAGMLADETGAMGADAIGEQKARLGGTARVIAFRRTGLPDAAAAAVIGRSSELCTESPIEEPDGQYVLLIDPGSSAAASNVPPVQTLRPTHRSYDLRAGAHPFDAPRREIYNRPGSDPLEPRRDAQSERLRAALTLSRQFEAFHARQRGLSPPSGSTRRLPWLRSRHGDAGPAATAPLASPQAPADYLFRVRNGALSAQQTKAHDAYRRTLASMIALFLCALLIYEIYIEFMHRHHGLLLLYVVLLIAGTIVALRVRRRRVQSIDEDYRGVKEMLRVQIAWWQAGITRPSVDRVHLRTIDTDMRLVREGMATLSLWALLRCDRLKAPAISRTTLWLRPDQVRRWLSSQAGYFAKESSRQKLYKQLADRSFEIALTTSLFSLVGLMLVLFTAPRNKAPALLSSPGLVSFGLLALLCLLVEACARTAFDEPHLGAAAALLRKGIGGVASRKGGEFRSSVLRLCFGVTLLGVALIVLSWLPFATDGMVDGARIAALALIVAVGAGALVLIEPFVDFVAIGLASSRHVERLPPRRILALAAISAGVVLAFCALACPLASPALHECPSGCPVLREIEAEQLPGFRALVLTFSVLLLAAAGMARFYTEKRNHAAQAAHYDDMHRAFDRARGHLDRYPDLTVHAARAIIVEIGRLALDEAEAWMKAHRERPAEPIAGS